MAEIGYQSAVLPGWGALDDTGETNPACMWPQSIATFNRLRREDSQAVSVLRAVTHPIRMTDWMFDPAGARPEVTQKIADSFGLPIKGTQPEAPLRTGSRFEFDEHLQLALLELPFGNSVFNPVYKVDPDGLLGLHKLAWRPPRTIAKWDVAPDGGLIAIEQYPLGPGPSPRIPVSHLVVYVNEREGSNWTGTSLLRSAYKNWLLKDRMLRAQALAVERNGLGYPVYTGAPLPPAVEVTPEEAAAWAATQRDDGLTLTKNLRAGEDAGASIPAGAKLELMGVSGTLPDAEKAIRYHDEQIARAVLAHFLNLGTETGSWALGSTFADFFVGSLNAVAGHIAAVLQRHVVEDLVDKNWGTTEPAPRIVPATIGDAQPATAEAIKLLIDSKALTPDEKLEEYLRQRYKLPVLDPATARTAEETGGALSDADLARQAAETVQKVSLGVGPVLDKDEARHLVQRAGATLTP